MSIPNAATSIITPWYMRIFLLDPEEYTHHVFFHLLSITVTVLAHLQLIFLALAPYTYILVSYLRPSSTPSTS